MVRARPGEPGRYNDAMNRRTFLGVAAGLTLADAGAAPASSIPVIDTHIHLYDPSRPQGVPWPRKDIPAHKILYQTSLPSRYRPIAEPLGIVGAIEVECSPWLEDNQWVLDVAQADTIMVGTVGRLAPGTPEFRPNLERFHKNPLYRGIRYGLGRQAGKEFDRPEFVADLKALADADLVLDTANPSVELLADVVRVSDRVPNLRVVVDHLPQMLRPTESVARASYDASMKAFRDRPLVYVKVSEVLRRVDDKIPVDLEFYRPGWTRFWRSSESTGCSTGATGRTAISGYPFRSDSRSSRSTSWARDRRRPKSTSGETRSKPTSGSSGPPASRKPDFGPRFRWRGRGGEPIAIRGRAGKGLHAPIHPRYQRGDHWFAVQDQGGEDRRRACGAR